VEVRQAKLLKDNLLQGAKTTGTPHDPYNLGRRIDTLKAASPVALSAHLVEEDKSMHYLETLFRSFNLALVDNASDEYSFLSEYFSPNSYHQVSRKLNEIFEPTFALGQALTKSLTESTVDCLGVLLCVRLNQHFAFELQRRKIPAVDSYINATNMLLWPRFQIVMDMHCESLRRASSASSGRGTTSNLSLSASNSAKQSAAPHFLTQRFGQFLQGILALSSEAGDDEPISSSLGRLRSDFEAFLTKLSKSIGESRKRERFLFNNYSLVLTIIGVSSRPGTGR
jgi:vacuolar protein sorting-associated protein 52